MARNGSGTYSKLNTFVAGNSITAAGHNQNWDDLVAEMTNSVAADGQTPITGSLKGANGTAAAPSYVFNSDQDTGTYRHGANELGFATSGTAAGYFDSAQKLWLLGALNVVGAVTVPAKSFAISKIADGTANRLYGTDGTGVATEVTAGAGLSLSAGSLAATTFPVPGSFKNLSIKVATNTTVTVAADFVTTTDGTSYQSTAVSSTVNMATTGADALDTGTIAINTWYAIWVVSKTDGTTKCIASTSATAPTMPATYTFKARVGWVQTINGSATLYGTWQLGRRAQYVLGLAQTGSTYPSITSGSNSSTMTSTSVVRFVPTATASILHVNLFVPASQVACIAANSQASFDAAGVIVGSNNATNSNRLFGSVLLESTNIWYGSSSASTNLSAIGWEDNI